ncbi:GntR family transcriptional regulator [Streptomyces xiamenensis]
MRRAMQVPAYRRVADQLRQRIAAGEFPAGRRLPSRSELSRQYGVGSNVAAAAVRLLTAEGVVRGRPGQGVYVREQPSTGTMARSWTRERLLGTLAVSGDADEDEGRTVRSTPVSTTEPAGPAIAARLGLDPGQQVVRSLYRLSRNDLPAMLCVSWEPLGITGGTPVTLPGAGPMAGESVVARMGYIGIRVTHSTETVTARACTRDEAAALDLAPGAPVAAIERTYYADRLALETADLVVPGERFRLAYEIPADRTGPTR